VVEKPNAIELHNARGHVRYEGVSFAYGAPGSAGLALRPVVHDTTIDAPPGQVVALLGATGSGKSTILNLLRDVTITSLRRTVGVVLQDVFLFSATIRDNIAYGKPEATDEEVIAAAKAVGAHELILRLEQGYATPVQERGVNLSPGQRQLIAFARAVLTDPRILVLDEATASIDAATEQVIQRGLRRLLAGRTAFVIAHRLATVTGADRIVVLDQGRIVEQGTHAKLLARCGQYFRLYTMGFAPVQREPDTAPALNGRAAGDAPPVAR